MPHPALKPSSSPRRKLFGEITDAADLSAISASPPPSLRGRYSADSHRSNASTNASVSSSLLFGEIPSTAANSAQSVRSNGSVCSLVKSTSPAFLSFWTSDNCRHVFLSHIPEPDLPNLRLVCHALGTRAAPFLFENMTVTFRSSTFSRPARMEALERLGRHVKMLTFNMPRTEDTMLPPLIDPVTGEQRGFVYEPQVHKPTTLVDRVKQPKYGTWDLTDLLIKQYPPLFHASTNVPAFARALSALTSLTHLRINCPGEDTPQPCRRSTVDYALISLRIAVERAPLHELDTLTIQSLHPTGLLYLQPMLGFGSTPSSHKRWTQIRKLAIHMDSSPVSAKAHTEHLRILHSYLRVFAPSLTHLFFRWRGAKGPSPVSLDSEPGLGLISSPPTTPPRSPAKTHGQQAPYAVKFPRLVHMELENAVMDASQVSAFIHRHRHTLTEFAFEDIALRSGNWDDALEPLTRLAGNDHWKQRAEEVMDVPIILAASHVGVSSKKVAFEATERKSSVGLSRWLSKSKSAKAAAKAKEQFWGCEEHMRRFLRSSVFPWR
ncbi:hypothetical protein K490DRAFT_62402 [Saccharata proteae CBS 121410]|uniref:Uncharacterized protein n=1 Tax=Saccharata proteae CBS 121410 TaxID=1314787 RepID=A0A9P4M2N9_9PEZI|nr:hypothetical protein K490DRAFT_62402 [Saccharata proteae CBS 121410]